MFSWTSLHETITACAMHPAIVRQNNEGTGTVSIWIRWSCFVRPREIGGPLGFEVGISPTGCHKAPGIGARDLPLVSALAITVHGRDTLYTHEGSARSKSASRGASTPATVAVIRRSRARSCWGVR